MSLKVPKLQVFKRAALPGEVFLHDERTLLCTTLGNLSAGGMYLKTQAQLSPGSEVRVVIKAKGLSSPVQAVGRVVRVEERGLAVEFTSISNESRSQIHNCVVEARMRAALRA